MGESWFHVFSRLYSGDDLCRVFKEVTQAPLPDDLDSWRSWFDTHPDLVWDEQRKHLVESLPKDTVPK